MRYLTAPTVTARRGAIGLIASLFAFFFWLVAGRVDSPEPRLKPLSSLMRPGVVWAAVGLVLIFAVFLSIRHRDRIVDAGRHLSLVGRNRLAVIAVLLLLLCSTLIPLPKDPSLYDSDMAIRLIRRIAAEAFLIIGVLSLITSVYLVTPRRVIGWLERASSLFHSVRNTYFVLTAFCLCFALTNLISYFVFEHIPHVTDGIASLFQAKIFAMGKLYASAPQYGIFFEKMQVINHDGKWYSQYPSGHPFMLTLGLLVGMPWLVNPLQGSLFVVVIYLIGRELYDEKTARLAALLAVLSPFLLFISSEYLSHPSALLFISMFLLCFVKTMKQGRWYHALLAGLFLGMVLNMRPLSAAAFGLPFGIYALSLLRPGTRGGLAKLTLLATGLSAMAALLLIYNYLTNGDPFLFGYSVKDEILNRYGFDRGTGHTPLRGLFNTNNNLNGLNTYLFEWPLPCLVPLFLLFTSRSLRKWDYLLAGSFLSIIVAYFFFHFQVLTMGPRYLYEGLPAIFLLSARGLRCIPDIADDVFHLEVPRQRVASFASFAVIACFLYTTVYSVPFVRLKEYVGNFHCVNNHVYSLVKKHNLSNALVFMSSNQAFAYGSGFMRNSPDLKDDVIYARFAKENMLEFVRSFPDRDYYYYDSYFRGPMDNPDRISYSFVPITEEFIRARVGSP